MAIIQEVQCRFCADAQIITRMTRHVDGRFICRRCGHVERPEDQYFECNCGNCVEILCFV